MLRDCYVFYWQEKRCNPTSLVTYLHFILFIHSLFDFYGGEEGKHSMMDHLERQGRLLVALALY
jgi:hypothetical protein